MLRRRLITWGRPGRIATNHLPVGSRSPGAEPLPPWTCPPDGHVFVQSCSCRYWLSLPPPRCGCKFAAAALRALVAGARPPVLLAYFTHHKHCEVVALQEQLDVRTVSDSVHEVGYNFTCLAPGRFSVEIFCEQDGTQTGKFPPPSTWINDTKLDSLRRPRDRPDQLGKPYRAGMPTVAPKRVAAGSVHCQPAQEPVQAPPMAARAKVVPARAGSWVRRWERLPANKGYAWDIPFFTRFAYGTRSMYLERKEKEPELFPHKNPNVRDWVFTPHDLLNGKPVQRLYRPGPGAAMLKTALSERPGLFAYFLGDSVMNNIWESFMAMTPAFMSQMDWRYGGQVKTEHRVYGPRGVAHPTRPSSLAQWLMPVSHDLYSNMTNFALNLRVADPLFRRAARMPTHVVISAGLWDAQSRPPSEYGKYLPTLIASLRRLFGADAHIIWVTNPPILAEKMRGSHYRTNEYLVATSRIAKELLGGMDRVTVADGHAIMSAMRWHSFDGVHYAPMWCVDLANIIWNIILST
eukprot:jgi/Tetstr1/423165/TSEL_013933.t1